MDIGLRVPGEDMGCNWDEGWLFGKGGKEAMPVGRDWVAIEGGLIISVLPGLVVVTVPVCE
ncbi:MAG: hypothetical protein MUO22_03475 [Sedimentisphaerales bacterium]|nr:hypothetical protein [Sedimentisphaerales bacterium]